MCSTYLAFLPPPPPALPFPLSKLPEKVRNVVCEPRVLVSLFWRAQSRLEVGLGCRTELGLNCGQWTGGLTSCS